MSVFLTVTECAIRHDNRYLLITRPQGGHAGGLLSLPGGKVEQEDAKEGLWPLEHAVKREMHEELGIALIDPLIYVTSSMFIDTHAQQTVLDIIFLCEIVETKLEIIPNPREVPEYHWLTLNEVEAYPGAPSWLITYLTLAEKIVNPK